MTVPSNGAKEVVTTVVTTTSPQTNSDYNMTKYQIHSEKTILKTEFSTSQYKNIQVLDSLEWSKGSSILQVGHCYQYRDQVPQLSLQVEGTTECHCSCFLAQWAQNKNTQTSSYLCVHLHISG